MFAEAVFLQWYDGPAAPTEQVQAWPEDSVTIIGVLSGDSQKLCPLTPAQ